ncbi:ATPase family AAA domain-containing protein 3B [Podospora australis]|uniref:ATPase family AAA domain-containing protein 3B n=1 Tax=Podospora australis TaxID=1536484 RepID=A0AAN6WRF5_9PEZI|nr:ATPase family AAA domain-containing protein 3B [Podospora australis]
MPSIQVKETANGGSSPKKSTVTPIANGENGTNGTFDLEKKEEANGDDGETKVEDTDSAKDAESDAESDAKKEDTAPEDQAMKCEIKHLDRRYDDKDESYITERKQTADLDKNGDKKKDWWRLFAFCIVRHYDEDGEIDTTYLYVNPQPIRELLNEVIGNYPGNPIDVEDVKIEAPYYPLFYYRKELETKGLERFVGEEHAESLAQLNLLLGWIKSHFELDITAYEKSLANEHKAIAYDRLWVLFPPGTIVYSKVLGQNRAFKVTEIWYDNNEQCPGLGVRADYVDYDGERLGVRRFDLFIPKYPGTRDLNEMPTMPFDLLKEKDDIREELIARGRKFEKYLGQHFLQYNGIALKKTNQGYAKFVVNGRVMIDCKTFHRLEPNDSFVVREGDEAGRKERSRRKATSYMNFAAGFGEKPQFDKLSDDEVILTNATVRGYSFTVKKFLEFFADELEEIVWNTKCFDDLVLDPSIKKTVQALVSTHNSKKESFDDIVKGKGQGLVCVLHGPPGVGKTLTAECVAEYVKRPLYMVSSGDLGTSSSLLDEHLTRIMDMTATWRAVLLIDEADVFLERRSLHDLHRNAMVSVFLRVLEYYGGILFLTTNRVNTFDDAFKSRIHIPIRYTDLSVQSRKQIWKNFCSMVPGGVDIDEKGLTTLAEHDLNGRQIKNAIKAAESLAAFDNAKLDLKQLLQITKIQAMFESDLTSLSGIDYTAPGHSRKDADQRNMFL